MNDGSIAIVGISCRFAQSPTPLAFWENILSRRSLLTLPDRECELLPGEKTIFNSVYPTRLGQLGALYSCVPSMQNFPRQVNAGENQDLFFSTQLAFDALAEINWSREAKEPIRGSVRLAYAPPFNASTINWLQHTAFLNQTMDIIHQFMPKAPEAALENVRTRLIESLPAPNAASFLLGTGYRFVSWIARECRFTGTASIMDAGNISAAVAIMEGIDDLRARRVDVSLVGAITPPLSRAYLEGLSGEIAFSARTELHPFEQDSDGTIPGEGGAFFVLKRREDALRDGDTIYAILRDVSIGRNPEDDAGALLKNSLAQKNIPKETISLIEAEGSGVPETDAREINMIQSIWGEHTPGGALVGVGSVKGNIGHTFRASMAAGLVKTALALKYRVLPPQIAPSHPIDAISRHTSSAYLLTDALPWITGDRSNPRRALVLGSNFDSRDSIDARSGRAAVILLEEEPETVN